MLSFILLAALAIAPAPPAQAPERAAATPALPVTLAADCPKPAARHADGGSRQTARARRLDELPPGRLELAVYRHQAGCAIPAVVREGIGGNRR